VGEIVLKQGAGGKKKAARGWPQRQGKWDKKNWGKNCKNVRKATEDNRVLVHLTVLNGKGKN